MKDAVRILLVANSSRQSTFLRDGLRETSIDVVLRTVAANAIPAAALKRFRPDLVLAGSADSHLKIIRKEFPNVPVITLANGSGKPSRGRTSRGTTAAGTSANRLSRLEQLFREILDRSAPHSGPRGGVRSTSAGESLWQDIFDNLSYAVFLVEAGIDWRPGRLLEVNPAACRLLGYERDQLVGQSLIDIAGPRILSAIPAATAQRPGLEPAPFVTTLRRRSRMEVSVEISAQRYESGRGRFILVIAHDLSRGTLNTETLQRLAAIVESSDDAIIGKTLEGIITSWNAGAKRLYGYDAGEVIGRPISILQPPDRPDEIGSILNLLRQGKHVKHYETVRITKDGRRLDISLTVSPIKDASGAVVGASATARDITEQKQRESERERLVAHLQDALARVKALRGLLPICAWCKRVRNDKGYWQEVEMYIREHADVDFSHGICPDCAEKVRREEFPQSGQR